MEIKIVVANHTHIKFAEQVCKLIYESALQRGTGIAERSPEYIAGKMEAGKAVIAFCGDTLAGFSYIETWSHNKFVATSGLIVNPIFRNTGLARRIKNKTFELSRKLFPDAKIFSITTGLAVMKLNSELGYVPVTFSELTDDEDFWNGCKGCKNYDILVRNDRKMCLCTGMLFDPKKLQNNKVAVNNHKTSLNPLSLLTRRQKVMVRKLLRKSGLLTKQKRVAII